MCAVLALCISPNQSHMDARSQLNSGVHIDRSLTLIPLTHVSCLTVLFYPNASIEFMFMCILALHAVCVHACRRSTVWSWRAATMASPAAGQASSWCVQSCQTTPAILQCTDVTRGTTLQCLVGFQSGIQHVFLLCMHALRQ